MSIRDLIPMGRRSAAPASSSGIEHPFFSLRRDVDRLFDDMFKGFDMGFSNGATSSAFSSGWPSVEVSDEDNVVRVTAELPGLQENDIELLLEDDVLTLRGEKRAEKQDTAKQFSERFYGRFERRIRLGYEIDQDKVEADFKNGVLDIVLPKDPSAQSRVKRISLRS